MARSRLDTRGFTNQLIDWAERTFERTVEDMGFELDRDVPVDTGQMQSGQDIDIRGLQASIRYPEDYASYTDEGTPPHEIRGNPLLAFEWGGELVIVHSVQHPGTKGTRWWSDVMNDRFYEDALEVAARHVRF